MKTRCKKCGRNIPSNSMHCPFCSAKDEIMGMANRLQKNAKEASYSQGNSNPFQGQMRFSSRGNKEIDPWDIVPVTHVGGAFDRETFKVNGKLKISRQEQDLIRSSAQRSYTQIQNDAKRKQFETENTMRQQRQAAEQQLRHEQDCVHNQTQQKYNNAQKNIKQPYTQAPKQTPSFKQIMLGGEAQNWLDKQMSGRTNTNSKQMTEQDEKIMKLLFSPIVWLVVFSLFGLAGSVIAIFAGVVLSKKDDIRTKNLGKTLATVGVIVAVIRFILMI